MNSYQEITVSFTPNYEKQHLRLQGRICLNGEWLSKMQPDDMSMLEFFDDTMATIRSGMAHMEAIQGRFTQGAKND